MGLRHHTHKIAGGGFVEISTNDDDWVKVLSTEFLVAEATGERPEGFVPQQAKISLNEQLEVTWRPGLELTPDFKIKKITIFNPNEGLPIEIEILVGTGDIRDSSVTFNVQSGVSLPVTATLQQDEPLPVNIVGGGLTAGETLDVAQVRPKQYINQATGHITLPLRKKAIVPDALHPSYFRGGRDYHNGIRGDYVSFARSSSLNYAFFCMEFLGQAQVFNSNPRRKKLTIRVEENTHASGDAEVPEASPGIIISNAPFNLGGEFSYTQATGNDVQWQGLLDHYIDTVLCRLGGFVPNDIELWDINVAGLGNQVIKTENLQLSRRYICDTAYGGGFVSGVYSGRRANHFARNAYSDENFVYFDSFTVGGVPAEVNNVHATSGGLGIFVGGDSALYLPPGTEHVITHQAPVWALSADSKSSLLSGRQEDYPLANFVWEEEYYVDSEIT